jgi:polar amino acid transport system permease protein
MPLLVLLIFVYNMPQALPSFAPVLNGFTLPAGDGEQPAAMDLGNIGRFAEDHRQQAGPEVAMVLSEAAYIAEIHRGGLLSIPRGQSEAARALG